jgi:hypothetical protein
MLKCAAALLSRQHLALAPSTSRCCCQLVVSSSCRVVSEHLSCLDHFAVACAVAGGLAACLHDTHAAAQTNRVARQMLGPPLFYSLSKQLRIDSR